MSKGLAFFDFDGTISCKDSFLEFFKFTHGKNKLYACGIRNLPYVLLFYLKLYPNHRLKERFFSFFYRGDESSKLRHLGNEFAQEALPKLCYDSAWKVLNWHREQGHEIYILTASSDIWLSGWCAKHNFELICTKFEEKDGRFTGKIEGKNCYGQEKAKRIEGLLKKELGATTYGYGDSQADKYYLQRMDFHYLMPLNSENVDRYWKTS